MAAMPGSHNSKERGARDLPQDVEERNIMQLLWSSTPCQEKVLEMQILAT